MTVEIDPFHAISVSRLAHELKAEGRSIIHMEFGQPSTGAPDAAIAEAHRMSGQRARRLLGKPGPARAHRQAL